MTSRAASCPSCGAPIEFRWAAAVQTVCPYCRSVLIRHDVDLEKVGTVAELPETPSPILLGAEGRWDGTTFVVVGRIVYEWEQGLWSEWHLLLADGSSAWLSDAQLDYAVSRLAPETPALSLESAKPGAAVRHGDRKFQVVTVTRARYRGVEGELPFEYWDKSEATFVDLLSADGAMATVDYSESPPLLFVGEYVQWTDLRMRGAREYEGW